MIETIVLGQMRVHETIGGMAKDALARANTRRCWRDRGEGVGGDVRHSSRLISI